ncbi:hypothetical protein AB1Y20_021387 [Prymnesium parvum]|uniref:Nucleoid-associated protein n=1 Tax=Prymnesium parvum TaxID=97485 RepID=A0AB34JLF3_PRYPA
MRAYLLLAFAGLANGLHLRVSPRVIRAVQPRAVHMLGGGGGDGNSFMDKMKAAQQMFNPEMMKKYSEVGVKVQALQEELAQTEIECATADGGVVVKVSGTQVPISVEVTKELCESGSEKASADIIAALKQAHMKSGMYAQEKMKEMYEEVGLAGGLAGMGGGPSA